MIHNDNKLIIAELARKHGTSYDVIKEAVESPFAFMYEELKKYDKEVDKLPDFKISLFGIFKAKRKYR